MTISRRGFLKGAAVAGGTLLGGKTAGGATLEPSDGVEFNAMLVDTTMCVGCRACEAACNEANGLPAPPPGFESEKVFDQRRDTTTDVFTVVNRFPNAKKPEEPIFVRKQCMHCNQPACATACLTKALEKTKEGPVVYNKDRCMGCRYCMIACPFDVPKYQYDSATPFVRKCNFCSERQKQGLKPACAEACPTGATLFGKKSELLEIARTRIYMEPDRYVHHVYGEREAGGTGWLYLLPASAEKLGLPTNLGTTPYPELTAGFLYAVPLVFVLWPSLLFGLNHIVKSNEHGEKEGGSDGDHS
jgi:Fe-S-cluster-containing dehydrogenase component